MTIAVVSAVDPLARRSAASWANRARAAVSGAAAASNYRYGEASMSSHTAIGTASRSSGLLQRHDPRAHVDTVDAA